MTTRSIGPFRAITDKEGKVKVVKRAPRMAAGQAKNKHQQAAREEKAWKAKSKTGGFRSEPTGTTPEVTAKPRKRSALA